MVGDREWVMDGAEMDRWQRCQFKVRKRNGCVPGEVAAGVA